MVARRSAGRRTFTVGGGPRGARPARGALRWRRRHSGGSSGVRAQMLPAGESCALPRCEQGESQTPLSKLRSAYWRRTLLKSGKARSESPQNGLHFAGYVTSASSMQFRIWFYNERSGSDDWNGYVYFRCVLPQCFYSYLKHLKNFKVSEWFSIKGPFTASL